MATLDDIATWAYSKKLKRISADAQEAARDYAVSFYRILCDAVPFEELMVRLESINFSDDDPEYPIGGLTPGVRAIHSLRMYEGGVFKHSPKRKDVRIIRRMPPTPSNVPVMYGRYGNELFFYPAPKSGVSGQMWYWGRALLEATPHETVMLIPPAWEELMKYEVLYRLYIHFEMHEKAAALRMQGMQPRMPGTGRLRTQEMGIIPVLWNDLLKTVKQVENADEDFSINPIVERYNVG